jgi:hypothetical protein
VPPFDRKFLDGDAVASRIGRGALGGKAEGLLRIRDGILAAIAPGALPDVTLDVPRFVVVAADMFDAFVRRNDLDERELAEWPDSRIAHRFQRADLPDELLGDLRALVESLRVPLAVRSSSLLEDALAHPFAGVYATKMIPNHRHDVDGRFQRLAEALKLVWASTFFAEARSYRRSIGVEPGREKMAVVLQEVVGRRHRDRFYPDLAGVGRSWNHYPVRGARPEHGVVSLALGLGCTIVDGGVSWTYSPGRPFAPVPFNSIGDLLKRTQTVFHAVNMGNPREYDPVLEAEYLVEGTLRDAEEDGTLRWTASTYDIASDRIRPGLGGDGPRVLDFAPILQLGDIPLNRVVRAVLARARELLEAEVEIEFAVTIEPGPDPRARLGMLQVRPMAAAGAAIEVSEAELTAPGTLAASRSVMGNGEIGGLCDVVYLRPEAFAAEATPRIAAEIEAINRALLAEGRRYLLIGFGRWGSSDPWLGVPVTWGQVSAVRAIVEATLPRMNPEPSQGSHFFHNLFGLGVPYLWIPHDDVPGIDWAWLDAQPARAETTFVRHVRLPRAVRVRVDGKNGRAVVCRDA